MGKGNVLTFFFFITPSEANVSISAFSTDHEMGQSYQLVHSIKSPIEHNIDPLYIIFYPVSSSFFAHNS